MKTKKIKQLLLVAMISSTVYCTQESDLKNVFLDVYETNLWHDTSSSSGTGSNLGQTEVIRYTLPLIFEKLEIKVIADAPCGDFFWMSEVDLSAYEYIGVDIVEPLIVQNEARYGASNITFLCADLSQEVLPDCDIIFCRDCLVHLSFDQVLKVLKNFKRTNAKYLLTTSFVGRQNNKNFPAPYWRPLNLMAPPFNFPKPLLIINEGCTENDGMFADKSLLLWRLADIEL